jgi:SAM-dependent methyltransferase
VLAQSVAELQECLPDSAVVLDVGGWGRPFRRADWVLDQMSYETRGLYGFDGDGPERYCEERWIRHDICSREPWPFDDDQFDFVICSHVLEDVRDPVWVASELARVGRAGYVEVPSRLQEQAWAAQGPWVGWGHHHWLVDVDPDAGHLEFAFKHHIVHSNPNAYFPAGFAQRLTPEQAVQRLTWTEGFTASERTFGNPQELLDYLESYVADHAGEVPPPPPAPAAGLVLRARHLGARAAHRAGRVLEGG